MSKTPLGLIIYVFKDIKSKVGIQAAEWIWSHLLEISYAYGAQGALGVPRGPRALKGWPLGVVKMTPLSKKKDCFSI